MSSPQPLVIVFGASGAQGSSVVKHILEKTDFRIRAISNLSPDVPSVRKLSSEHRVEVIIHQDPSRPLDWKILQDAQIAFLVTPWNPSASRAEEFELGKSIVDQLALSKSLQHLVFSSAPNVEKESEGKYDVPHFTNKALIEEYIRTKDFKFVTFLAPAFYYQNFKKMFKPQVTKEKELIITLPETSTLTGIDISEIGPVFLAVIKTPKKYKDEFIALQGQHSHPQVYIDAISKKLGKPVRLNTVSMEEFEKTCSRKGAGALAHMFGWFNQYTYYGSRDRNNGQEIYPFKDFATWLNENTILGEDEAQV